MSPETKWEVRSGDALEVLRALQLDGEVDAVVTDPPYCAGATSEAGKRSAGYQGCPSAARLGWFAGDDLGTPALVWLLREIAVDAYRLLRPGGSFVVFCDWRMIPMLAPGIESSGLRWVGQLVWDKGYPALGNGFRSQHEMALHFTKGRGAFFNRSMGNVLSAKRPTPKKRHHPTQKPVELLQRILRVVAPAGGLVLDPFCGSGSHGCAAMAEGMRFLGIERGEAMAEVARARLAAWAEDPERELREETVKGEWWQPPE